MSNETVTCKECGAAEELRWNNECNTELRAGPLCFKCNHWQEKVAMLEPSHRRHLDQVIVDGKHYLINRASARGLFAGFGGHPFSIEFLDGRRESTTNLWHQGTISPHFRDRLKDNARFARAPGEPTP